MVGSNKTLGNDLNELVGTVNKYDKYANKTLSAVINYKSEKEHGVSYDTHLLDLLETKLNNKLTDLKLKTNKDTNIYIANSIINNTSTAVKKYMQNPELEKTFKQLEEIDDHNNEL